MLTKEQKNQKRSLTIEREWIDKETRSVKLAFSSETPVERSFGYEILDNTPAAVDLSRLRKGGAVLIEHNASDQVGVVEAVTVDTDRVGRAVVRFGRSAKATEIWQDILDGIRRNVSISYQIFDMQPEGQRDGIDVFRVTHWQPLEISLVSVPADSEIGVGRSLETENASLPIKEKPKQKTMEDRKMESEEKKVDIAALENVAKEKERVRIADIMAMGEKHQCRDEALRAVNDGISALEFGQRVLESRYFAKPIPEPAKEASLGLSDNEARTYSLVRALRAAADKDWSKAPYEKDISDATAKKFGRSTEGFMVPFDIMSRGLTKGAGVDGGHTSATEWLTNSFIDLLRNKMVVAQAGITQLSGLIGDVVIPKQTGGATAYWVAEDGKVSLSTQAFGQVPLAPKTLGAATEISRKLLLQSSLDVEAFVRNDLATTLALAIDSAVLCGSGSDNQPQGILNTPGVSTVSLGEHGAEPTYCNIVSLETAVATANADLGSLAYITNAKVRGKLKTTPMFTNTGFPIWENDTIGGYKAFASNQMPANLGKGKGTSLSAIVFGNWADLIIGEWGALNILVNPYANDLTGAIRVTVLQDIGIVVRHVRSFATIMDAIV